MSGDLDDRVTDLEIRYTHEVETVRALNDVIVAQGKTIDALGKRIAALEAALRAVASGDTAPNEPPPHYLSGQW